MTPKNKNRKWVYGPTTETGRRRCADVATVHGFYSPTAQADLAAVRALLASTSRLIDHCNKISRRIRRISSVVSSE